MVGVERRAGRKLAPLSGVDAWISRGAKKRNVGYRKVTMIAH
jgi:hypothetical protein